MSQTKQPEELTEDDRQILIVIGVLFVLGLVGTAFFYYYMYSNYRSGQRTCDMLHPGGGLKSMRLRELCKDRKRGIWAHPFAFWLIS